MVRAELTIGDFARRSRLPVSTLRYYDRIGLLTPAAVDPGTGYRRYRIDQLPAAVVISQLRSLGITPDSIAQILKGRSAASAALTRERQRIAAQIDRDRERLRRLDEFLVEGPPDDYEVEVVDLAGGEVAALPFVLPAAGLEAGVTRAIAGLRSALRRAGDERSGAWGATFPLDLADKVSGYVFAPVVRALHGANDMAWLPASRAIAVVHHGVPARLPLAYSAAFAALDRLGADASGPVIEEYMTLDDPDAPATLIRVNVPFHGVGDKHPGR